MTNKRMLFVLSDFLFDASKVENWNAAEVHGKYTPSFRRPLLASRLTGFEQSRK
jgi:hypothetical protein